MRQRCLSAVGTVGQAVLLVSGSLAQTSQDRARSAAATSRARTSNSAALLRNFITPALAGQPLETIDQRSRFTPSLSCAKSAKLLEIVVQPATSGDLKTVQIARDTDLDGRFDTNQVLPMPLSGLCANGFISCEPGTWRDCHFFRWTIAPPSELTWTPVAMPNLSSCYCINASCGANLAWANMPKVLADLGGGIVGALTSSDPRFGIAEAQINGPMIDYVGAQLTSCTATPTVDQTRYANSPGDLTSDATAQAQGSSLFETVKASPAASASAVETRRCTLEREIKIASPSYDETVSASGAFEHVVGCGPGCRRYRLGGDGACGATPPSFSAHIAISKPDRLISARILDVWAEDWVQVRLNGQAVASAGPKPWMRGAVPTGTCEQDGPFLNTTGLDLTDVARKGGFDLAANVYAGGSARGGYVDFEVRVDTECATTEALVDLCRGYGADPNCTLQSERVDGIETVRGGVATGLTPLPSTRFVGSGACTIDVTRPFFERDRSYQCRANTGPDTAPDLTRARYIIDHSTQTHLADRVETPDGGILTSSQSFTRPTEPAVPACETLCKTTASKVNAAATPAGVVAAAQNNPVGKDVFYHVCDLNQQCPVGPGETLVRECGCLDTFPDAAVMMQTVRLAGTDIACTRTTRP